MNKSANIFLKKLTAWAKLFRLPNLFTVPGDPLAGLLVAAICLGAYNNNFLFSAAILPAAALPILAALALYMYGLASNDIADYDEDRLARPSRPLPSGAISFFEAKCICLLLLALPLLAGLMRGPATLTLVCLLGLEISLYNFLFKKHRIGGPFFLGLCRATSFLMGAAAMMDASSVGITHELIFSLKSIPVFAPMLFYFFYIYGLSRRAADETVEYAKPVGMECVRGVAIAWPILVLALASLLFPASFMGKISHSLSWTQYFALPLAILFSWLVFRELRNLKKAAAPAVVQKGIGALIRNTLIFQATLCALADNLIAALTLLLFFPLAIWAGRKFYGS